MGIAYILSRIFFITYVTANQTMNRSFCLLLQVVRVHRNAKTITKNEDDIEFETMCEVHDKDVKKSDIQIPEFTNPCVPH